MNNDFDTLHLDISVMSLLNRSDIVDVDDVVVSLLCCALNVHDETLSILPCLAMNDILGIIATRTEHSDMHSRTILISISIEE